MDLVGQLLGSYRLQALIGQGGTAEVYSAQHPSLHRQVAVKVLAKEISEDPDWVRRFRQEVTLLGRLDHPNILPIYDTGEFDGRPFFVMKYVENSETLRQQLNGTPWPLDRAIGVLPQVAEALHAAHEAGVVHRDVKPSNILVTPDLQCLVFDFGIAKPLERRDPVTGKGLIIGTPEYMSPEQCQGGAIDHRTDIYSLGILAYELFTGDVPFTGETAVSILMRHVTEPLPVPSKELALPPALIRVLERATASSPDDRYTSAREMGRAILRAAEGSPTVTVRSQALGETMSRWRRRAPRISGRAALFFFSAVALGVAGTIVVESRLPAAAHPPPTRQTQAQSGADLSGRQAAPDEGRQPTEKPFIPPRENRVFNKSGETSVGPNESNRESERERRTGVGAPVFKPAATNTVDLEPPRRWEDFLTDSNCTEKGGQQGELHVRCAERCIREGAQPMLYSRGKLYRIEGFSNITVSRGEPISFKGWLNSQTNAITAAPDQ